MASIKDVAKLAGVGLGTASRVINNKGSVKQETREKVLKAIEELDYYPNEVARNFQSQSTKIIALIVVSVWHPFFSKLAYFVEKELYDNGYKLLICNSEGNVEKEVEYLKMLERHQVAGIIALTYSDFSKFKKFDMPIVAIDRYINSSIPHLSSNNYQGGVMAAEQLINCGATKFAYLGGKPLFKSSVSERKNGMMDTMLKHKLPYVIYETTPEPNQEINTAISFYQQFPDVDGIFAGTDLFALSIIKVLRKNGLRVPEDVQVIGFDGIQENDISDPYLSTICQPVEKLGKESVDLLLAIIEGKTVAKEMKFDVFFRQGDTTRK